MKTVEIVITSNPVHFKNDPRNFTVTACDGWDLGAPLGNGATKEKAIEDFKENWYLKYDEEIEVVEK
jgi:hypothetical protein